MQHSSHPVGSFHTKLIFLFSFHASFSYLDVQIIIQNLTTYNVYTVNVQAASSSIINPRRILLGSHSASRKVSHTYVQQEYEFLIHLQELCSCACVRKALILIFYTNTTAGRESRFFFPYSCYSKHFVCTKLYRSYDGMIFIN